MCHDFRIPRNVKELKKMLDNLPRTPQGNYYRFLATTSYVFCRALEELAKRHSTEELKKILCKVISEVESECKST